MKKILFTLLGLILALGASATNYVVWSGDDLSSDEEQIGLTYYGWYNAATSTVDDTASPESKALKVNAYNLTVNTVYSCGWVAASPTILNTLVDYDLVFYAKREGTGTFWIRLTSPDTTYDLDNTTEIPPMAHIIRCV